ncbi:MAG: hypothetical protein M1836_005373 [Candelina mexicana]|nr:MAG: hypothetical protein M1836_005373 [Candelina mexicana]
MPFKWVVSLHLPYCIGCVHEIIEPRQHKHHHIKHLPYLRSGQNQVPELRPLSHHAHQIAQVIESFMRRPVEHRAPIQHKALSTFWNSLGSQQDLNAIFQNLAIQPSQHPPNQSPEVTHQVRNVQLSNPMHNANGLHPNDLDNITQCYFKFFDDFLFGGLLGAYDGLTSVVRVPDQSFRKPLYGCTSFTFRDENQSVPGVLIKINQQLGPSTAFTAAEDLDDIIQTLLHEMVHAMFGIYACHCVGCLRNESRVGEIGLTRHGEAWVKLAKAVEEVANEWADGMHSFDLGIVDDVEYEEEERAIAKDEKPGWSLQDVVRSLN